MNKSKLQTTIPYNLYVNPETLEMEKKEIFYKDWIMVGHESQVKNIGEFFTFDLVGEPLIITKNNENQLNAMYNICPHRGTIVERSDHGNKKILQCMYHEWTLHLDGKLNRAPNFGTNELEARNCLRPVQLDVYQSLIFINLNPHAKPLAFYYDELKAEMEKYPFLKSLQLVKSEKNYSCKLESNR